MAIPFCVFRPDDFLLKSDDPLVSSSLPCAFRPRRALFCPGLRVGIIQDKRWDIVEYDVVIAMVLTLAKRDMDDAVLDDVGTVVCDECHHYAAPVMNLAMRKFRARHIVGLTATKPAPMQLVSKAALLDTAVEQLSSSKNAPTTSVSPERATDRKSQEITYL